MSNTRTEAIIAFELTMPNNNAWDGQWSGSGQSYVVCRRFGRGAAAHINVLDILKKNSHYYNFGDGWGANVSLRQVTSKEATVLRKNSRGFCGYDWMISSIIKHGKIIVEE